MEPIGKNVYHYQLHQNDPSKAAIENKGREFSKKGLRNIGPRGLKAYVSQEILNWHSIRHSHSAEL